MQQLVATGHGSTAHRFNRPIVKGCCPHAKAKRPRSVVVRAAATGDSIKIYYKTGWKSARIHGTVEGAEWKDFPLEQVATAPPNWLLGSVPVNSSSKSSEGSLLEFVVTDGNSWDKPQEGGNYTISSPGCYSLRGGRIKTVSGPPIMVVSDLDGTMVGDDEATAAFKDWWEDVGALRGGLLVYNTGRALGSFEHLLQEKSHCLAHPTVLISAVGTKIYNWESGQWVEDPAWETTLARGWDVEVVRGAAYEALNKVGKEQMHFRPPDEQNDHKVTCGVNVSVLKDVTQQIESALVKGRVSANIIVSGTGDWRFLDLVPKGAGKLQALEHVRRVHRFTLDHTIACGDSGNDILMLSGKNLALVVGNAQPDLKEWVQQHKSDASPIEGKQRLYTSEKHEAHGILEGLEYWGLK